jgi:hypothetical protein
MIIKFSEKIQLGEWERNTISNSWKRRKSNCDEITLVRINCYGNTYTVEFHNRLEYLQPIWNIIVKDKIINHFDIAKDQVDNFIIKMSKMKAFI